MEVVTNSPQKTKALAQTFAKNLKPGDIVCLLGDLGTGKTTFVQGLAKGLGVTRRILSPSFVFIREYDFDKNKKFYHVDLYRLENEKRVEGLGLEEVFRNKNSIVVIEWANRIKKLLPLRRIEINFFYGAKKNQRKIAINRRD